mgnify:CR=1 FL=1
MFIELTSGGITGLVNTSNLAYLYPFEGECMLVFINPIESKGTRKMLVNQSYEEVKRMMMEGK